MTYIPGLNVTYEEDEMKSTDKNCTHITYGEYCMDWDKFSHFPSPPL